MQKKAISPLVSGVLYTAIIIMSVSLVVSMIVPSINEMTDSVHLDSAKNTMSEIDLYIQKVASESEGSRRVIPVSFGIGSLKVESASGASNGRVIYSAETSSKSISPKTSMSIGNLRIQSNSNTNVSVLSSSEGLSISETQFSSGTNSNTSAYNGSLQLCWNSGVNCNWAYRKKIIVNNTGNNDSLADYQMPVNLTEVIYNNTGLVGSWHFTNNDTSDSSGYGNNGAQSGGVNCTATGKVGGGCGFDGVDDYVSMPNSLSLQISATQGFTIEAWIKANGGAAIVSTDNSGTTDYFRFYLSSGKLNFVIRDSAPNEAAIAGATTLTDGTWHHIVGMRDVASDKLRLYVDGAEDATAVTDTTVDDIAPAEPYYGIGATYDGGSWSQYFNGSIDEVRIYNRSLSAAEISEQYQAGKARLDLQDIRFTQHYIIYETQVNLSGTGTELTDYQVLVNITNTTVLSHMRADGGDLRFFANQTSAPYSQNTLPYWIENISSSGARVWVRANVSAGGSTLYMYYGNSSAASVSNGTNTFMFFDDFDRADGAIGNGWTTVQGNGNIYGNKVRLGTSTPDGYAIRSGSDNNIVIEEDFQVISGDSYRAGGTFVRAPSTGIWNLGYGWILFHHTNTLDIYDNGASVASATLTIPADTWYKAEMRIAPNDNMEVRIWQKGAARPSSATLSYSGAVASTGTNHKMTQGGNYNYYHKYSDNWFVRKYSPSEPSVTIGSETIKSQNEAPLNHWQENDNSAWINIPYLAASSNATVYMYYGNPSATYNNSLGGNNTFLFFDDFSDGDMSDWTTYNGAWSASNYYMRQSTGGVGAYRAKHNTASFGRDIIIEAKMDNTGNENGIVYAQGFGTCRDCVNGYILYSYSTSVFRMIGNNNDVFQGLFNTAKTVSIATGQWYTYRLTVPSTSNITGTLLETGDVLSWSDSTFSTGGIGVNSWDGSGHSWDDIRVRKYSSPEPAAILSAEESRPKSGTYLSNTTSVPYAVLSITPVISKSEQNENVNVTIGVSADGGESWISAVNGTTYTSGGGIGTGSNLKYRLVFSSNDSAYTPDVYSLSINYSTTKLYRAESEHLRLNIFGGGTSSNPVNVSFGNIITSVYQKDTSRYLNGTISLNMGGIDSALCWAEGKAENYTGAGKVILHCSSGGNAFDINIIVNSGADFIELNIRNANTQIGAISVSVNSSLINASSIDKKSGYVSSSKNGTVIALVSRNASSASAQDSTINIARSYDNNNFYIAFTKGDNRAVSSRINDVLSGDFDSYYNPSFGFKINAKNTVEFVLSYDNIKLQNSSIALRPGNYQLGIENMGSDSSSVIVTLKVV